MARPLLAARPGVGGGSPRARRSREGQPRVFHAAFLIVFFMLNGAGAGPARSGSYGARTPPVTLRTQGGRPLRAQRRAVMGGVSLVAPSAANSGGCGLSPLARGC
jgi:hypothetical protein